MGKKYKQAVHKKRNTKKWPKKKKDKLSQEMQIKKKKRNAN